MFKEPKTVDEWVKNGSKCKMAKKGKGRAYGKNS